MKRLNKNIAGGISVLLVSSMLLFGCTANAGSELATLDTTKGIDAENGIVEDTNTNVEIKNDISSDIDYTEDDIDTSIPSDATTITLSSSDINIDGSGAAIENGDVVIKTSGAYRITGEKLDTSIIVEAGKNDRVRLILDGVSLTCSDKAPINIKEADKVIVTLAENSENKLVDTRVYKDGDDEPNASLYSEKDMTINGKGSLNIEGGYRNGIATKDDLLLIGGSYNITAVNNGILGKDSVTILDGSYKIDSKGDGIKSNKEDDETKGNVIILDGSFEIKSGDDGLHAEQTLHIIDGTIDITDSYEGLEGSTVVIDGGDISVIASDDGINSAGGSDNETNDFRGAFKGGGDYNITINGGAIKVDAQGDGIDANGNITINDGDIEVKGPMGSDNTALDFDGTLLNNGGKLIATGSARMLQQASDSSLQSMLTVVFTTRQEEGLTIGIRDDSNNVIEEYTTSKELEAVTLSSNKLVKGKTYTVYYGNSSFEIELDSMNKTISSDGTEVQMGRGGPGGRDKRGPKNNTTSNNGN